MGGSRSRCLEPRWFKRGNAAAISVTVTPPPSTWRQPYVLRCVGIRSPRPSRAVLAPGPCYWKAGPGGIRQTKPRGPFTLAVPAVGPSRIMLRPVPVSVIGELNKFRTVNQGELLGSSRQGEMAHELQYGLSISRAVRLTCAIAVRPLRGPYCPGSGWDHATHHTEHHGDRGPSGRPSRYPARTCCSIERRASLESAINVLVEWPGPSVNVAQ
jgi:hypothetical protein